MRVAIITSNHNRHKFYCNQIAAHLELVGIVSEDKAAAVTDFTKYTDSEKSIIAKHFAERDAVENEFFGTGNAFPDVPILQVDYSEASSQSTLDWLVDKQPEIVLLYGSSIIKAPVLTHFDGRIINLHLGLSPYYKGSATNFWPLVEALPECVGATIHLATLKVDAGAILHQVRPTVEKGDRAHHLGSKTILAALEALPMVVNRYIQREISPKPQNLTEGKVFRTRDFNPESLNTMWRNLENGMIGQYLDNKMLRDAHYPIVTCV